MLNITQLSLQRGGQWLLRDTSVSLQPGQRVAVVGANGAGKSSLFQLILGELSADAGEVSLPGGCRIAHMAQEVAGTDRAALDYVLDGHGPFRDLEAALARAERDGDDPAQARLHGELDAIQAWDLPRQAGLLLQGLGFSQDSLQEPVKAFSGGWRIRLSLARALMQPSDFMLLDEPTNHLDIEACYWLEGWLRRYPGTLLVISHDRDFMDRVATQVLHFEGPRLVLYQGGYSDFERQRAENLARQQAMYEKQQAQIAHMQRFIDRFRAKATKARAAQSRIKALERLERIAPAHVDSPFSFEFPPAPRQSTPLLNIRDGSLGYDGEPLLSGINLQLLPGSRIGLLGPNGAGKSTLIDGLRGARPLLSGERVEGEHFRPGFFAQHQLDSLDLQASPFTLVQRLSPDAREQSIRDFLGGFGFNGDAVFGQVAQFSGGERARLALALIAWQRPNVLLLDEPTNHLDLEMRQALTLALQGFEGALVVISHDRHLLRHTVDGFWRVHDGQVEVFEGDLDEYEQWLAGPEEKTPQAGNGGAPARTDSAEDRRQRKRAEAEKRQRLSPMRKAFRELEKRIEKNLAELKRLESALADPALYEAEGKEQLRALLQEQAEQKAEQERLEARWLELGEAIEELEQSVG